MSFFGLYTYKNSRQVFRSNDDFFLSVISLRLNIMIFILWLLNSSSAVLTRWKGPHQCRAVGFLLGHLRSTGSAGRHIVYGKASWVCSHLYYRTTTMRSTFFQTWNYLEDGAASITNLLRLDLVPVLGSSRDLTYYRVKDFWRGERNRFKADHTEQQPHHQTLAVKVAND